MKKTIVLGLLLVVFASGSAFASEFLGGRWGVGIETLLIGGADEDFVPLVCQNLFVSYDPVALPALQMRLGFAGETFLREGATDPDSRSKITLTGLYRPWDEMIAPYVGVKVGAENYAASLGKDEHTIKSFMAILLGAEWRALDFMSLFVSWVPMSMHTTTDTDNNLIESNTTIAQDIIFLGMLLYL